MDPTRTQRFEQMFTEHYAAVRGYALRRTSADAAQDTVAETFLVAWRRLEAQLGRQPLPTAASVEAS